ncbi:hypothetical protein TeGR_g2623 [Tetraparma gracilis]|uniref:tRNA pseudouridine synthase n=1 Tax=Tetraparma gracilis TaxID=2962635 RepID=A0ABQ6MJS7_9STRA|nr:hypothetical protein TeGR_g2623 [Tetraparma gracilis]
MQRYAISFSYCGSRSSGWGAGIPAAPSPQRSLPHASQSHRLSLALCGYLGCSPSSPAFRNLAVSSRTDAGVSALRNTLHRSPVGTLYEATVTATDLHGALPLPASAYAPSAGFGPPPEPGVTLTFRAPAFLNRQVRCMVGCLLAVGGGAGVGLVERLLGEPGGERGYEQAPAGGLCLVDVRHHGFDEFDRSLYGEKPTPYVLPPP